MSIAQDLKQVTVFGERRRMRLLFLSVFGIAHTSIGLLLNPHGFCVAQISQAIRCFG